MSKELGDSWTSGGGQLTRTVESDGSAVDVGDAVDVDGSGQAFAAGDTDNLFGVVSGPANDNTDMDNLSAGDELSVVVHGPVVGNVAGTVSHGNFVDTSATGGQLAQAADGNGKAYSDAGATIDGGSLGANEAAVFIL